MTTRSESASTVILSDPERSEGESKDPCISRGSTQLRVPHSSRQFHRRDGWDRTPLCLALLFIVALLATIPAHAQGCAQCLDSTRATPPAVQAAYRHAIELLGGVAATLFVAALILFRREP